MQSERLNEPHILLVENEDDFRTFLKDSLEKRHHEWQIHAAPNKPKGLRILKDHMARKEPIALVLTDLQLKSGDDTSGMDILREAREVDPLVMVILYTGHDELLKRYSALELGAFDVIEKTVRKGNDFFEEVSVKAQAALKFRELADRVHFLRRYFDPRLFEMIEKDPSLLNLKKRTVTICFWDIQGFSLLSEQLKAAPELVSGFLREYYDAVSGIIFQHEGVVDKFIGDGVMALFGVFSPAEDPRPPAVAAVEAAKEVRLAFDQAFVRWRPKWQFKSGRTSIIGLRCGIHTSESLVGNTGTESRDQFTALGEGVNLASRFEQEADGTKRQILLSQTTQSLVTPPIRTVWVKQIPKVKNIEGPFDLYEVEG